MKREDYEIVKTHTAQCNMGSDFWDVKFKDGKKPKVFELVDYVVNDMSKNYHEWGQIELSHSIGDTIVVEYDEGSVKQENELKYASIKDKTVEDLVVCGGWSKMDWILRKLS